MRRKGFIMTKMVTNNRTNILRDWIIYFIIVFGVLPFPIITHAQIKRCPICKKSVSNCKYKGKHLKCNVCGNLIDECIFKGNHPQKETTIPIVKERTLKEIIDVIEKDMIYVEGGTFMMGAQTEDVNAASYEKPAHQVIVSSFYISKCEVTQEIYKIIIGNNPDNIQSRNFAVGNVSWNDCQAFILKLNSLTGKTYRLPTEAEWEFAARGGNLSKGYIYSGSNNPEDVAVTYNANRGIYKEIMSKNPNELGTYDMSGNVEEWCSDWYGPYTSEIQTNPYGPATGDYKITRGGSFAKTTEGGKYKDSYRVTNRSILIPSGHRPTVGFRLVRNP